MANTSAVSPLPGDEDLRARHRQVIEDYFSRRGEGRLTRYQLFTEDGSGGLWTNDTGGPLVSHGREGLKAHGAWSLKCFPDWKWFNVEIYETQDPNRFWVECDGEGKIFFPGYPEGFYRNHFIHSFLMENGRIKQNREFMNPYEQMRALGIPFPPIKREGIPA
jgi:phenazine biosynthesis protein